MSELSKTEIRVANQMWSAIDKKIEVASEWHLDIWQRWSEQYTSAHPASPRIPFRQFVAELIDISRQQGKPV